MTKTYSNKSNAKRAAEAAGCVDPVLAPTPTGWTWAAPSPADVAADLRAEADQFEREGDTAMAADVRSKADQLDPPADHIGDATEMVDAAPAKAPAVHQLVQAKAINGRAVAADPNDPRLVDGVLYPNATRAAEARKALTSRKARGDDLSEVTTADAKANVTARRAHRAAKAPTSKRAQREADAAAGIMPTPPDFSAETHKRFRGKLADLVAMADARDVDGLVAYPIKVYCSSTKPLDLYRNLAVVALRAQLAQRKGAA